MISFSWEENMVENAKQRIRDIWNYKPVDKMPINFTVYSNPKQYTLHEQIKDSEKQFEVAMNCVRRTFELVPLDYIPVVSPEVGNVIIENAFGLKSIFPDNPEQTPIWTEPLIKNIDEVYDLKIPDPYKDEFFMLCLDKLKSWVSKLDGKIPVGSYDIGSPINTALNLMGADLFYLSLILNKDAVHHLLEKITSAFLLYYTLLIDAGGGINNMGSIYFPLWVPEGKKGIVADDICANISPEMFNEFSKPYNSRIFRLFGPGLLHNCGPNPCLFEYIDHDPPINAIHVFYDHSKNDLEDLSKTLSGRAVLYVAWWGYDKPEKVFKEYRDVCEKMAPDCAVIMQYSLDDSQYTDKEILTVYNTLDSISIEYTKSLSWI